MKFGAVSLLSRDFGQESRAECLLRDVLPEKPDSLASLLRKVDDGGRSRFVRSGKPRPWHPLRILREIFDWRSLLPGSPLALSAAGQLRVSPFFLGQEFFRSMQNFSMLSSF